MLVLVSFFNTGRMAVKTHCCMYLDGASGAVNFVEDHAIQGSVAYKVPPAATMPASQRAELDTALAQLPDNQAPADSEVFLVSWLSAGKWETRTYDRTHLPDPVVKVCDMLHIPKTWIQ